MRIVRIIQLYHFVRTQYSVNNIIIREFVFVILENTNRYRRYRDEWVKTSSRHLDDVTRNNITSWKVTKTFTDYRVLKDAIIINPIEYRVHKYEFLFRLHFKRVITIYFDKKTCFLLVFIYMMFWYAFNSTAVLWKYLHFKILKPSFRANSIRLIQY